MNTDPYPYVVVVVVVAIVNTQKSRLILVNMEIGCILIHISGDLILY